MNGVASSVVVPLIEVGNIDTVYRDVYLDRARALLAPVLAPEDFHRLEQERAALAELPLTIARALDHADWPLVKQLCERAQALKHEIDATGALLETARSVYEVGDVRLDPFSPGLQPFAEHAAHGLASLRARALGLLRTLEQADAAWSHFYEVRRRAFEAHAPTASDVGAADAAASSPEDALAAARRALRVGDMKRVLALADVLIASETPSGSPSAPGASIGSAPAESEPGQELQAAPYSRETRDGARALGLASHHLEPRVDLASLRRYAWTPLSDTWGSTEAPRLPLPPGSPASLQDNLVVFTIHPLVNSGGARYLPRLLAEDVLVEDFPDPQDDQTPPASELLKRLRLPARRGVPRVAIERALLAHGGRILEDDLRLDPRAFRLVCIPPDVYLRVGEASGWGRQPLWTHFDGYLIRTVQGRLRLQALAGGDVRYGGLYHLLAVGRDYDSSRLLARFAVVQRARMTAW